MTVTNLSNIPTPTFLNNGIIKQKRRALKGNAFNISQGGGQQAPPVGFFPTGYNN